MRFDSKEEILAHPHASLIPLAIFNSQFNCTLSDLQLDLMRTPFTALTARIESLKEHSAADKLCHWLCIAYGHPGASVDELMHFAQELGILTNKISITKLFGILAFTGQLTMINQLTAGLAPADLLNIIKADDYAAFRGAAQEGHVAVVERLIKLAPDDVQNMMKANRYYAFTEAAFNGHLAVVEKMIELALWADVHNMIRTRDYIAFQRAAGAGNIPLMEKMIELTTDFDVLNMIQANNYEAFNAAAREGHLAVMEKLIELTPAEIMVNMVDHLSYTYMTFRQAASNGHLAVMEKLIELAPADVFKMIGAGNYSAFREAASHGHFPIMEKLLALVPDDKILKMITASDYDAFVMAAHNGHLDVMECLLRLVPAEEALNMIKADNYGAFRRAVSRGHLDIVNRLLSFPTQMAYAETHKEYDRFTHPFIATKLTSLQSQRQALETAPPEHVAIDVADASEPSAAISSIQSSGFFAGTLQQGLIANEHLYLTPRLS